MKSLKTLFIVLFIAALLLVGCSSGEEPAPAEEGGGEVVLLISGAVDKETGLTDAEVKAMKTLDVQSTNKDGETKSYTGVLIADLLNEAGANGTTVVFVADDGFTGEVTLEEVMACENCIVSFRNNGGFSIVMPDFPGNVQVKGVVEIQVK
jgi:hypothetical protein